MNVLLLAAIGVVAMGMLVAIIVISNGPLPDPGQLVDRSQAQSTKILDRTGEHVLFEVHGEENRTFVPLDQVPLHVQHALLSAEDDGFYQHHGIDLKGILRSVVANVLTGGKGQGGSTITQQLVKNAFLTREKTYSRKLREIVISLWVERRFTKDEILQMYFNEVPFGSTNYGIESAAQNYYGKHTSELTVAEGAALISMTQAPTRFINNPDQLEARRNRTLDAMVGDGYLTQEEADAAKATSTPLDLQATNIMAPHFVFYVKELLEEQYDEAQVEQGGLRVRTTIDYDLQKIAEEEVAKAVEERGEQFGFSNAALVALDPKTGEILAMVGSHDYFDEASDGAVNVALRPRQPGSSIKPIAYTALFAKGFTPNTVLYDVETVFPSDVGPYTPHNYDLKEHGPVTVRTALQGSLNIPAVKALYLVGVDRFLDFAESLGYTTFTDRSRFGLAVVLGGGEVTLLEHVAAYATFANEGTYHEPVAILQVDQADRSGERNLFTWQAEDGKRVLEANIARMITNVLSDDAARQYAFGAGSKLQLGARPAAAKTGTTNDYRDAWTLGYTPSLVVGVWGGNNRNQAMVRGAGGSSVAAPIWNAVMTRWFSGKPIEAFTPPAIPELGKAALDGKLGQPEYLWIDRVTGLRATDETPVRLREYKGFVTNHSLLYYVDKEDPTGDVPGLGSKDPQFQAWEDGVQAWVKRQQEEQGESFVNEEPPTEFDDVHTPANQPRVSILTPSSGQSVSGRTMTVEARPSGRREIVRVEVSLDGVYLGASTRSPWTVQAAIPASIGQGSHTLRVSAFDDVENEGSAEVTVMLVDGPMATVRMVDPQPQQTIERRATTYAVRLELDRPDVYSSIALTVAPRGGAATTVASAAPGGQYVLSLPWTLPEPGEYILSVQGQQGGGVTEALGAALVRVVEAPPTNEAAPATE